jgi:hypothetical protein
MAVTVIDKIEIKNNPTLPVADASRIAVDASGFTGNLSTTDTDLQTMAESLDALVLLADTGTPGTYGTAAKVPVFTTDTKGRVTSVTDTDISITASQISNYLTTTRVVVRTTPLDGFSTGTDTSINVLDTVESAFEKAQGQIDARQPLDATLTALAAYNTNGLLTQTAADTFTGRTITGTASRISITDGNGVLGNPTIDIDTAYVGQTSITTLGTVTTGTWTATTIALANGGTGSTTAAGARTNLGLGTIATQSAASVAVTGGSLDAVTLSNATINDTCTFETSIAPRFARLGLGTAASATSVINGTGSFADPGGTRTGYNFTSTLTLSAASGQSYFGMQLNTTTNASENHTGTNRALSMTVTADPAAGKTVSAPNGAVVAFFNSGAGSVTSHTAYLCGVPSVSGGGTLGTFIGFNVQDASVATNYRGFQSTITSGTNKWHLFLSGSAASHLNGNVAIGTTSLGTNAAKVLSISGSTAPTSSPTDTIQIYSTDFAGAGTGSFHVRNENGDVISLAKQTITGSRAGNAALADLLTKLASLGLITDSTTA